MRPILIISFVVNFLTLYLLWETHADYTNLLTWACENASLGGHECGED